jgi:hypothetical protein
MRPGEAIEHIDEIAYLSALGVPGRAVEHGVAERGDAIWNDTRAGGIEGSRPG